MDVKLNERILEKKHYKKQKNKIKSGKGTLQGTTESNDSYANKRK